LCWGGGCEALGEKGKGGWRERAILRPKKVPPGKRGGGEPPESASAPHNEEIRKEIKKNRLPKAIGTGGDHQLVKGRRIAEGGFWANYFRGVSGEGGVVGGGVVQGGEKRFQLSPKKEKGPPPSHKKVSGRKKMNRPFGSGNFPKKGKVFAGGLGNLPRGRTGPGGKIAKKRGGTSDRKGGSPCHEKKTLDASEDNLGGGGKKRGINERFGDGGGGGGDEGRRVGFEGRKKRNGLERRMTRKKVLPLRKKKKGCVGKKRKFVRNKQK